MQPVTQMTRVVRVNGAFYVQGEKRLNGRGAHVCSACKQSPNLQKCLSRSFKTQISTNIIDTLTQK